MKLKIIYAVIFFLLLVFSIWRLWPRPAGLRTPPSTSSAESPSIAASASASASMGQQLMSIPSDQERAMTPEQKREQYIEKARSYGISLNRPAHFYGQILDQNNQPVVGVQIVCELSYFGEIVLPGLMPQNKKIERISNSSGRFTVDNVTGLAIQVQLMPKEGYEFKGNGALQVMLRDEGANRPAPTLSTKESPYIFHAFKKGQAEPLIVGSFAFYDWIPDGRFYSIDLKRKRITENTSTGDLKVAMRRPLGPTGRDDYDWSVKIDGVNTDIVESHDEFMCWAPESGYIPSWAFAQQVGEKKYTREVLPKFYLKSRDGSMYGRIEMQIISDYQEAAGLIVHYWLNPAGSRNLEYAAAKEIKAK